MPENSGMSPKVSAFIICFNEEAKLESCLRSIAWCDEIVVVDSGSTDRTLEIAKRFTDRVYFREWTNYVEQKQFALEHCAGEWVLNIDSDEQVTDELKEAFLAKINQPGIEEINGFYVNRVVFYLGRYWRKGGWYPEYRLRIARRSVAMIEGFLVHEKMTAPGRTERLEGELLHYTYDSISDHLRRIDSLSTLHARALFLEGRKVNGVAVIFLPVVRFCKFLFVRQSYREGLVGIGVAYLEALSTFLKYFKLWNLDRESKAHKPTRELVS